MSLDSQWGFGLGVLFTLMVIFGGYFAIAGYDAGILSTTVSFTVADSDPTDLTIYTTDGEILKTNKFEWKRLRVNTSYLCDKGTSYDSFRNCREIELSGGNTNAGV